jgi:hypothetical protein
VSSVGFASPDQVDPVSAWQPIYQAQEKATSPAGFEILQRKYPSVFKNYDSKTVTSANYSIIVYEFREKNTCPENDPRLKYETTTYGLCQNSGDNETCFQTVRKFPISKDPCGN